MLRDSLRPVRDVINAMSTKRRIWSLVGCVVCMLVLWGVINLTPWIGFWLKLGIFVTAIIITICFAYAYFILRSKEIAAERQATQNKIPPMPKRQPSAGVQKLNIAAEPIKLSSFAHRRIAKQQPILKNSQPILEQRISRAELFVQLEKRRPTGETVKRIWAKKPRPVLEPRKTIWVEIFWCVIAFLALAYALWLSFSANVEIDIAPKAALLVLVSIVAIITVVRLYIKLAYWYFWRLLLFRANEDEGVDAKAVIIDKPFLIPGGSVPSVDLRILRLVSSSTARSIEDERSFESILAGWLGVEWLLLDTYGQGDARFNWMGPFRNAPMLVAIFDHERRKARIEDQ